MKQVVFILIVFAMAAFSKVQAQTYVYIEQDTIRILPFNFYIKKVVDDRPEKILGEEYTSNSKKKKNLKIYGGLPSSLGAYMKKMLPKREGKEPIIVHFKELKVMEVVENHKKVSELYARIEFFVDGELAPYSVFQNDYILRAANENPKLIHEENIKNLIMRSIRDFHFNYEPQDYNVIYSR